MKKLVYELGKTEYTVGRYGGEGMKETRRKLWQLFWSTLYLSAFTFGGGYVIVTLMKRKFVDDYHWIDEPEMLDLIAIAQSAPGAIAVNGAIVVGYKLMGMLGAAVAIVATILPPFVIISVISYFYQAFAANFYVATVLEGMQAGGGGNDCVSGRVDFERFAVERRGHAGRHELAACGAVCAELCAAAQDKMESDCGDGSRRSDEFGNRAGG